MANILILTPQLPYPPHQGTSLRNFHIIRGLAETHNLTLLSFVEDNQDVTALGPLTELCQQIETVPVPARTTRQRLWQLVTTRRPDMAHRLYSPEFNEKLENLLRHGRYDLVQIEGIELARTIEMIRIANKGIRIVFDDHNAETELQRRNMLTDLGNPRRWLAAAYSWVQTRRLARFERWACLQADWVTAVSTSDKKHLQALAPDLQTPITVIPNCLDVQAMQTQTEKEEEIIPFDLVFSGKMDYRPNVDAVLWFATEVWPLVQTQRPSTTWAVVGQKPHPRLDRLRTIKGITITGWVDSVRPYISGANLFIMPFRIGSGTRLKLIEAMAAGKPIVSTAVGAEGFPVQSGREIVLVDGAGEMAANILALLANDEQRHNLGQAAQQFAQQYDWRVVIPQFNQIYQGLQ